MNKYLEQLVTLSKIDKQLDAFVPQIENINKNLTAAKDELKAHEQKVLLLEEEIKELKLTKGKFDLRVKELTAKLEDLAKKSANIKSEKEMKALSIEEDITKEELDFSVNEIDRIENEIESKSELLEELKSELESVRQRVETLESETSSELESVEKQKEEIYKQKADLTAKMNQKMLVFYEKIRKWAKDTAVVEVKKHACYGCFMRINDKVYNSVVKGEEITACPHCGRILYMSNEELSKEAGEE